MEILHVAHRDDWEAALASGTYRVSTRGAFLDEVGFIHASYPHQISAVAKAVHGDDDADLCVLVLDPERIRAAGTRVVDEDGGDGELYPHVYGPIEPGFVTAVRPAAVDASGAFRF
ncbi:DUF952 domain-containing protein [Cellulomonas fengjieae]|uniref:DUF952 domain-containing protein n=1 Tax=Cellulomonas fengjieae TaxID=2819978 RepID=A0ABS3SH65_9CELL|nr:DUF952 domain-containing protein [Cellulomonas fengjieae]MBO3085096.1 DUF952 domain-containing protein [Cellulomonas fengjieae]QVI66320.1 DUF952 domain-containing protein [Cellulomonas fengjieae]